MKLIPMTDFVLEQKKENTFKIDKTHKSFEHVHFSAKVINYAKFLKQPLELWMFVPCWFDGGKWLTFDESKLFDYTDKGKKYWIVGSETFEYKEYQKAKERVLFEGFRIKQKEDVAYSKCVQKEHLCVFWFSIPNKEWILSRGITDVESLVAYSGITLTKTAIKQIGL